MKKILIALSLLFLASCDQGPRTGPDGYKFGTKQYEQNPVIVSVVTYKSQKDLYNVAKSKGADYPEIVAFSVLTTERDKCTVHMMDPSVSYQPEYVGHEFLHCVYGQWHTNNDSRS